MSPVFAVFEMDFCIKILGGQSAIARILRLPRGIPFVSIPCRSMKNPLKQSTRKKSAGAFPMVRENEVTIRLSSRLNGLGKKKCRKRDLKAPPLNEDLSRRGAHYLILHYRFIRITILWGAGERENPIWSIKFRE